MAEEIRWKQRLSNFKKAMTQLERACGREKYDEIELAGLVKIFEFSFELAWKTLQDLLHDDGFSAKSPRETIRQAFEDDCLTEDETEVMLEALEKRNVLSHTYREEVAKEAESLIKNRYFAVLRSALGRLEAKAAQ